MFPVNPPAGPATTLEAAAIRDFCKTIGLTKFQSLNDFALLEHSVREDLNGANPAFGRIADPFLVADFGGWTRAKKEIVDRIWKGEVLPGLGK